jgi:hypothetical protein
MPTAEVTCGDCFFRREYLCALSDGPCPTFRAWSAVDATTYEQLTAVSSREAEPSSVDESRLLATAEA